MKYLHKRSSTQNKRPEASSLGTGEIALNYNSADPGVFFEANDGSIVKVGPAEVGNSAPNSTPTGSSGNSAGELWFDTSGVTDYLKLYNGSSWVSASGIDIDPSGNWSFTGSSFSVTDLILSPSASAPPLASDGEVTFEATDNSTLSVKHRGTDATTRTGRVEMNSAGGTFGICAHASFDGSAGASFNWLTDTFASGNVSNIVRNASGNFTITFATNFTSANYTVVASAGEGNHTSSGRTVSILSRAANSVQILVERTDQGSNEDEGYIALMVIGSLV